MDIWIAAAVVLSLVLVAALVLFGLKPSKRTDADRQRDAW
jgi:hypothetical protein